MFEENIQCMIQELNKSLEDELINANSIPEQNTNTIQQQNTNTIQQQNTLKEIKNNNNFEDEIIKFVIENNPKLCILTPCYGSMCHISYTQCLIDTVEIFRKYNFKLVLQFCKNDSLVTRARNNLIAKAMNDESVTHIMFIDSDISWHPLDIMKLILYNKPLVGGIYPQKRYHWNKLYENNKGSNVDKWIETKNKNGFLKNLTDSNMIQYNLLKYNLNVNSGVLHIDNNLTEIKHLATGFMLIQRHLIEKMFLKYYFTKYIDDTCFLTESENKYAYALFDCGIENTHYYSEDWLFCDRWSKMGGSIYADVTIRLVHSGIEEYNGCYLASLL
jgi:hypothetical protein